MAFTRPKASQIDFDLTNITDPIIRLNSGETGAAGKDTGIVLERGDDTNVAILYDESADEFVLVNTNEGGTTSGNVTISSYADLQVATINTATLEIGGTAVTSTAVELNILDGVTATTAELNYVSGVTSAIQTQIDNISSSFTIAGDTGSDSFTTGQTLTFSGTANEITTAVTDNTVTVSLPDNVTIGQDLTVTGNLTVSGTTTTISTTNSVVSDSLIELNTGAASNTNDLGIVMERGSTGDNAIIAWDESADAFVMGTTTATGASTGNLTITAGALSIGSLTLGGTAVTSTAAELNILDGVTSTAAELNLLDGVTGTLVTEAGSQTLTNKTLTSAQVTTDIRLNAQAELEFYDSDSSHYVSFRAPATIASSLTWTLPATDGTDGQVLSTNGTGTLAWADAGAGGGSGSSYPNSTFTTVPGTNGDFDMSYNVAQTVQETPFEASGTDAFGVNLGSVFTFMDPVGTTESIDYGDGEAYVGA